VLVVKRLVVAGAKSFWIVGFPSLVGGSGLVSHPSCKRVEDSPPSVSQSVPQGYLFIDH
jgi:hypothetical protein